MDDRPFWAALRIALVYFVVATIALLVLHQLPLPDFLPFADIAVVTASAVLLFLLIRRALRRQTRARKAIAEERARFRDFAEISSDWAYETDADLRYTYISGRREEVIGDPPETLLGKTREDVTAENLGTPGWQEHLVDLAARRPFRNFQHAARDTRGRLYHVSVNGKPVFGPGGRFRGYRGTATEITAHRVQAQQQQAVAALGITALSGTSLPTLMEQLARIVGRTLDVELCSVLELTESGDRLVLKASIGWQDAPVGQATVSAGRETQAGYTLAVDSPVVVTNLATETRFDRATMLQEHGVVSGVSVVIRGNEQPFGTLGAYSRSARTFTQNDVNFLQSAANVLAQAIERRRSEEAMRLWERAVAAASQGVVITDPHKPDNPVVYINPAFEQITGYAAAEMLGRNLRVLQGAETEASAVEALRDAVANRTAAEVELVNYTKGGTPFWSRLAVSPVREDGAVTHFVGVMSDVSDRRRLEEQLRQSQKLETVGRLTGGVAHDFNNLLTVILGNAETLARALQDRPDLAALAEMTRTAAERGAELTNGLLAFARRQALQARPFDLNRLVLGMEGLLRRTLGEQVEIQMVLGAGLFSAFADPAQVESALLNLAVNARDAMSEGGKLTIETANMRLDEDYVAANDEVRPGLYAMLAVTDTGAGMAPEVVERAFEPFFTTKPVGKGSGLGLSMVYGFVKQSGGHVKIYSEPEQGTTIRIYLPRAETRGAAVEPPEQAPMQTGSETILVVEDSPMVREFVVRQLRSLGYAVLEAEDGPSALARLAEAAEVDLLFTDVVMPGGMTGRELAEEACRRRPGLRLLFTSGYTENSIVHNGRLDPGVLLLNKPYRRVELARKVRAALDGDGCGSA